MPSTMEEIRTKCHRTCKDRGARLPSQGGAECRGESAAGRKADGACPVILSAARPTPCAGNTHLCKGVHSQGYSYFH